MQSLPNIFLDFDGTLVRENSSHVLENVLSGHYGSKKLKLLHTLHRSFLRRPINLMFAGISRLMGGRDARLLTVLWLGRAQLTAHKDDIYAEVARRLTLNAEIANEYSGPFTVLSAGLEPIIHAFINQHPELICQHVVASRVNVRHPGLGRSLRPPQAKTSALRHYAHYRYLTDSQAEADHLHKHLPGDIVSSVQHLQNGENLYILVSQT